MRKLLLIIFFLIMAGCSSTKKVLICGDHVCVNKEEAKQYFADNLSLEVRIVEKKKTKTFNLIEMNSAELEKKSVKVIIQENKQEKLRILTKDEIDIKKKEILNNKQIINNNAQKIKVDEKTKTSINKKIVKLNKKEKNKIADKINVDNSKTINKNIKLNKDNIVKNDICLILDNCNIEEITEYLLKKNNDKSFPDLTVK